MDLFSCLLILLLCDWFVTNLYEYLYQHEVVKM